MCTDQWNVNVWSVIDNLESCSIKKDNEIYPKTSFQYKSSPRNFEMCTIVECCPPRRVEATTSNSPYRPPHIHIWTPSSSDSWRWRVRAERRRKAGSREATPVSVLYSCTEKNVKSMKRTQTQQNNKTAFQVLVKYCWQQRKKNTIERLIWSRKKQMDGCSMRSRSVAVMGLWIKMKQ